MKHISLKRSVDSGTEEQRAVVKDIIVAVKSGGDQALYDYTEKFDRVRLSSLKVTDAEIEEAYQEVSASNGRNYQRSCSKYP